MRIDINDTHSEGCLFGGRGRRAGEGLKKSLSGYSKHTFCLVITVSVSRFHSVIQNSCNIHVRSNSV